MGFIPIPRRLADRGYSRVASMTRGPWYKLRSQQRRVGDIDVFGPTGPVYRLGTYRSLCLTSLTDGTGRISPYISTTGSR